MTKCKKILLKIVPALLLGLMLFTFIGCKTDSGLDKYVSEKRTEIYYCEQDGFTLTENGYENDFSGDRLHHEIYLSDPRRSAPEKWRTVIRHPIKTRD